MLILVDYVLNQIKHAKQKVATTDELWSSTIPGTYDYMPKPSDILYEVSGCFEEVADGITETSNP